MCTPKGLKDVIKSSSFPLCLRMAAGVSWDSVTMHCNSDPVSQKNQIQIHSGTTETSLLLSTIHLGETTDNHTKAMFTSFITFYAF